MGAASSRHRRGRSAVGGRPAPPGCRSVLAARWRVRAGDGRGGVAGRRRRPLGIAALFGCGVDRLVGDRVVVVGRRAGIGQHLVDGDEATTQLKSLPGVAWPRLKRQTQRAEIITAHYATGFLDPVRANNNVSGPVIRIWYTAEPQIREALLSSDSLVRVVVARQDPGHHDTTQIIRGGLKFHPGVKTLKELIQGPGAYFARHEVPASPGVLRAWPRVPRDCPVGRDLRVDSRRPATTV